MEGLKDQPAGNRNADFFLVSPSYFRTMEIPLVAGRVFAGETSPQRLAVVNETLVKRLFEGRNPIGQRVRSGDDSYEIVGVFVTMQLNGPLSPALSPSEGEREKTWGALVRSPNGEDLKRAKNSPSPLLKGRGPGRGVVQLHHYGLGGTPNSHPMNRFARMQVTNLLS